MSETKPPKRKYIRKVKVAPQVSPSSEQLKEENNVVVLDKENIDNSKILLEIQIDSGNFEVRGNLNFIAFITLYDAESEDQLKTEIQNRINMPQLC